MADSDRTVSLLGALLLIALLPAWGEACDSDLGSSLVTPQPKVPSSQQWLDPLCDGMTVLAVLRIEDDSRLAAADPFVPYGLQFRPAIADALHADPAPWPADARVRVLPVEQRLSQRPLTDGAECALEQRSSRALRYWL